MLERKFFSSNDWRGAIGDKCIGKDVQNTSKGKCWATKDDRNNAKHIKKDKWGMIYRRLGAS
jgi:hypothetical protein